MVNIKRLSSKAADFPSRLRALLAFDAEEDREVHAVVACILADVKARGDAAVLEYTQQFDGAKARSVSELEVSKARLAQALATISRAHRESLEQAAQRIRAFHEKQLLQSWEYTDADGSVLGQRVTPLERVGVYVPGGKAAYPSTVMMNTLPAKVARVPEITMVVPAPDGQLNDLVLAAAAICEVDRVFALGGAQAIAALAYGTETIAQVDKIVGPGNVYVAAAKKQVYGTVGIDMIAGPSEILVICDGSTPADWIAMDLFSQAEHDEQAQAILLTPDAAFIEAVADSIERQLAQMPRHDVIRASLEKRGALILVQDLDEACEVANRIAPEHIELSVANPEIWVKKIKNAGAIFMGIYSSESLGDYCAGPNHVLPTSRTARFSSPLGVYDFQKRSSVIQVSQLGAKKLGAIASSLALGEGLAAHARSAEYRMK